MISSVIFNNINSVIFNSAIFRLSLYNFIFVIFPLLVLVMVSALLLTQLYQLTQQHNNMMKDSQLNSPQVNYTIYCIHHASNYTQCNNTRVTTITETLHISQLSRCSYITIDTAALGTCSYMTIYG